MHRQAEICRRRWASQVDIFRLVLLQMADIFRQTKEYPVDIFRREVLTRLLLTPSLVICHRFQTPPRAWQRSGLGPIGPLARTLPS